MISKIVKTILLIFTAFGLSYGIASNQPLIDSSSLFRTFLMHALYIILSLYLLYNFYKRKEKILAFLTLFIFILLIIYTFMLFQLSNVRILKFGRLPFVSIVTTLFYLKANYMFCGFCPLATRTLSASSPRNFA